MRLRAVLASISRPLVEAAASGRFRSAWIGLGLQGLAAPTTRNTRATAGTSSSSGLAPAPWLHPSPAPPNPATQAAGESPRGKSAKGPERAWYLLRGLWILWLPCRRFGECLGWSWGQERGCTDRGRGVAVFAFGQQAQGQHSGCDRQQEGGAHGSGSGGSCCQPERLVSSQAVPSVATAKRAPSSLVAMP